MVRNYVDRAVPRVALERILDLARRAPSAGFSQGQSFVVVTAAETRREIARIAKEDEHVERGYPRWISRAPVHVVVCVSEADYHARYQEPDKLTPEGVEISWPVPYWWVDAGASVMLVLLAAVNEGLDAGFFGVPQATELKQLLGIPEQVSTVGIVTIGCRADRQPKGSASRGWKAPEEVIHWERW